MRQSGNLAVERQRQSREDPMSRFVSEREQRREEKYARVEQLMLLVDEIRVEEAERKRHKEEKKALKKIMKKEKKAAKAIRKKEAKHSRDEVKRKKKDKRDDHDQKVTDNTERMRKDESVDDLNT